MPKMGREHSESGYQAGCRCDICRNDHSLKMRAQRAKKAGNMSLYESLIAERGLGGEPASVSLVSLDRPGEIPGGSVGAAGQATGSLWREPESLTDIAYEALITMIRHCEGNPDARPNYTSDYNGRDITELVVLIDAMQDEYPNMLYQVSDDGMTLWFGLASEAEPEPAYVPLPVTAPRVAGDSRSAYERQVTAARRQRDLALGR